jgi:type I restriction enzyme, S subunit
VPQNRPSGWRLIKIKDVCREVTVGHVGPMATEYVDEGIPFLRSQNITPFRIENSGLKYINPDFHMRLSKSALRPGDVVVVRTGYPGTACVIPESLPTANCADLVIIRPSPEIDPRYLACIFNSAWGRDAVAGKLVGVAQQHFNIGQAKEMVISLPPIETQIVIASILSTYDNLIENNNRRIEILEEMARSLYREWFVNFRFPGHECVKMVQSQLGLIPFGWRGCSLQDVASFISRGVSPKYDDNAVEIVLNQKCIRNNRISLSQSRHHSTKLPPDKMVRMGDVLVNSTGVGTLGRTAQLLEEIPDCTVDSHVSIIRSRNDQDRDYFGLQVLALQPLFERSGKGATGQTELSRETIASAEYLDAPEKIQSDFGSRVRSVRDLTITLQKKNVILNRTRELLLPKLVSGEIDVSRFAEEQTEVMA